MENVRTQFKKKEIPPHLLGFFVLKTQNRWVLRNKICWSKQVLFQDGLTLGSCMPSSVKDRFNQTWEPVYFFTKSKDNTCWLDTWEKAGIVFDKPKQERIQIGLNKRGNPKYDNRWQGLDCYFNLDVVRVKSSSETWGMNKSGQYFGKDTKDYEAAKAQSPATIKSNFNQNYQGKFSGLEEAEKFNSPGVRTQRMKRNLDQTKPENKKEQGYGLRSYYDQQEGFVDGLNNPQGKNPGSCWLIGTDPLAENHFAAYPEALCIRPILAGSPPGGIILDLFAGRGTTGIVALKAGRQFVGFDASPEYVELANKNLEPYKKQEVLKL